MLISQSCLSLSMFTGMWLDHLTQPKWCQRHTVTQRQLQPATHTLGVLVVLACWVGWLCWVCWFLGVGGFGCGKCMVSYGRSCGAVIVGGACSVCGILLSRIGGSVVNVGFVGRLLGIFSSCGFHGRLRCVCFCWYQGCWLCCGCSVGGF